MTLVTIGIPVYSRFKYLDDALKSALGQSYKNIEVIISQNFYEGETAKCIEEYAINASKQYPNVRYIKQETNKGLAGNWNELVKNANGEYIIIIGDDDVIPVNAIVDLLQYSEHQPSVIFGNQKFIDKNGAIVQDDDPNTRYFRNEISPGLVANAEKYVWMNSLPITGSLIRLDLLKQLLFREDLNTPEQELFLRLYKTDQRFYFTDAIVSHYRIHDESETSKGLKYHNLLYYLIHAECTDVNLPYKNDNIINTMGAALLSSLYFNDVEKFYFLMNCGYLPAKNREKILRIVLNYSYMLSKNTKITYRIGRVYYNVGRRVLDIIKNRH